jgi:hypothetical protein
MIYSKVFLKRNKECLSKPEIRFGNYFFQWDEGTKFGLSHDEINSFRNFVKKVIPYLEQCMKLLQDASKFSHGKSYHERKKLFLEDKYNSVISFLLFVDVDGKTTFYRQEKCELIDDQEFNVDGDDPQHHEIKQLVTDVHQLRRQSEYRFLEIKWILGELLFDRTEKSK